MAAPPERTAANRRGGARRRARAAAVQALYQWHMTGQDAAEIERQFLADRLAGDTPAVDRRFFHDLLHGVVDTAEKLDRRVEPLLDRPVAQVDPVECAILRIGAFELVERSEIPDRGDDQRSGRARQDLRRRERSSLRERGARPAGPRGPDRREAPPVGPAVRLDVGSPVDWGLRLVAWGPGSGTGSGFAGWRRSGRRPGGGRAGLAPLRWAVEGFRRRVVRLELRFTAGRTRRAWGTLRSQVHEAARSRPPEIQRSRRALLP